MYHPQLNVHYIIVGSHLGLCGMYTQYSYIYCGKKIKLYVKGINYDLIIFVVILTFLRNSKHYKNTQQTVVDIIIFFRHY